MQRNPRRKVRQTGILHDALKPALLPLFSNGSLMRVCYNGLSEWENHLASARN